MSPEIPTDSSRADPMSSESEKVVISRPLELLERITAAVLIAVVVAVGWMVLVAHEPLQLRLAYVELEVLIVLILLAVSLLLVSIVALLHTRP
jgi:hypothetical protein